MVRSLVGVFLYGIITATAWAQSPIWDGPVAEQPFDAEPFQKVRISQWVQQTTGVGYTLSGQSFEQRQRAVSAGVTIRTRFTNQDTHRLPQA